MAMLWVLCRRSCSSTSSALDLTAEVGRGHRLRLRRARGDARRRLRDRHVRAAAAARRRGRADAGGGLRQHHLPRPAVHRRAVRHRRAAERDRLRRPGHHRRRCSRSASRSAPRSDGVAATPRASARGAFFARNPPLWACVLGLLAPDALAPGWAIDASHVVVFALLPLGFFVVGVTLAAEAEDGAVRFPPPLTAPVAAALGLRMLVAPAVVLGLSAGPDRRARLLPLAGGDGERRQLAPRRARVRARPRADRGRDRVVDADRGRGGPGGRAPIGSRADAALRTTDRDVRRRAAAGAAALRALGRGARRALPRRRRRRSRPTRTSASPARSPGSRTAPGTAAPTCPRPPPPPRASSCSATSRIAREHEGAQAENFEADVDYTDETADANPELDARPLRPGDRPLALDRGAPRRRDARLGRGAGAERRGGDHRARPDDDRPVHAGRRPLHARLARRLHRRLRRGAPLRPAAAPSWRASRCTRTTDWPDRPIAPTVGA